MKIDLETINKIDKSNMLKLLLGFPSQIESAKGIGDRSQPPKDYDGFERIVFAGLGGSAIGADLIRTYLQGAISIPIIVNRNYTIPGYVDDKTLFFACSYSGNTEETLEAYRLAKGRSAKIAVLTSGGKLKEQAQGDGLPVISIPLGIPPRTALGFAFFPALLFLAKLGIVAEDQAPAIAETQETLAKLRDERLKPEVEPSQNVAKSLAQKMYKKFPIVYGAEDHIDAVVTRWRTQLAENAKHLSSTHVFPEMNHNEIVGWENPRELFKHFLVVVLRDREDHTRVKHRMDITKAMIGNEKVEVAEVHSEGKGLLSRIFSLVYIGDFVSFYLAILNGVDPTPVDRVTYLKEQLAKR